MASLAKRSFDSPDETRPLSGKGEAKIVDVGGLRMMHATYEPGWRWSEHVKPIVGGESCQSLHAGYVLSGRLHVRMDDGTEEEVGPGDAFHVPPGHDGWVVGDEACVMIDFGAGVGQYAKS
jgi:quercetin dioxygenase-like cupin family protein